MEFKDIPIHSIGNDIWLAGAAYTDAQGEVYVFGFPDEGLENVGIVLIKMNPDDWKALLKQSDTLETEVSFGGKKAILRKCERIVDTTIMWQCFRRDAYRCRYCGNDKVPLTVDHVVCWEKGGPSTEDNMLTCCKTCNRKRGNMPYEKWLESDDYKKSMKAFGMVNSIFADEFTHQNKEVLDRIVKIEKVDRIRSR
jgi:hypothetical protein